ncbi:twitching motility protein PilT [Deltaproteobacteria bacterium]|nr:twitching motility protein PilT [Deltaproteobacteria bacterium]
MLLLDTCAYLIATHQPELLPAKARRAILSARVRYWSPVGTWEIAVKSALGRVDFPGEAFGSLDVGLAALCVTHLPMTHAHAARVHELPPLHKDPFDRLLIAQALADGLTIVTADEVIPRYPGVTTIWG